MSTDIVDIGTAANAGNGDLLRAAFQKINSRLFQLAQAMRPRGIWATTTAYVMRDVVSEGGVSYIALVDHVSGTFSTDLASGYWVSSDAAQLALDLNGAGGGQGTSIIGTVQSGVGAEPRSAEDELRRVLWAEQFGSVGDASAIQRAINEASARGGGEVHFGPGTWIVAGDGFVNVLAGVTLRGAGSGSIIKSQTGGRNGHHVLVYAKDYSTISDFVVEQSDYTRQSGGPSYIAYNKVGITTQGAATGNGIRIKRVGFSKCGNSHVYVHDSHDGVSIDGCYTVGQQVGHYADVDANYEVTDWSATMDSGKLSAGTQCYCLTNFFNSGIGTRNVTISNGRHININDAFVGVNGNAYNHTITGNVSIKVASGYYGGYGADLNTGDSCTVSDNTLGGYTAGVHLYGSVDCVVASNRIQADIGIWLHDPVTQKNVVDGNKVRLSAINGTLTHRTGLLFTGAVNNLGGVNFVDGAAVGSNTRGVCFESSGSGAVGNMLVGTEITNTATGIESADSSNDGNWSFSAIFRTVTTPYPRQINSNHLQFVKGISGSGTNANNLCGAVTVSGTDAFADVAFTNTEPDNGYRLVFGCRASSGSPASGAFTPVAPTSKATSGFRFNVSAAPGGGSTVTFDWLLVR